MLKNLLACLCLVVFTTAAPAQRPVVLVVHGRGQLGFDSAQVRRDAWHALESSTRNVDPAFTLEERDVRLVWYADVLDAQSQGGRIEPCSTTEISEGARERETVPSALSFIAMLVGPLFDIAAQDTKNKDALDLRRLAGDLRYFADVDARCAAERRIANALRQAHREGRPVILMSHSLGALVTWGEFMHAASVRDTTIGEIHRWITLGSPLGSPELRQLIFGDDRAIAKPIAVRSWVNILGEDDPFAARISGVAGDIVSELRTATTHSEPHHILSYLYDRATGTTVRDAWRSALAVR